MTRAVPDCFYTFIKNEEKCVLHVYDDAQPEKILVPTDKVLGTLTAGYGHTGNLVIGQTVTDVDASNWLISDSIRSARLLEDRVGPDIVLLLTDNQYAALISFVFNLGANPTWTIWKRLKAKQFESVPSEMMRFVNATVDGKIVKVQGLVNRRAAEVALWSTDEPGTVEVEMPSSTTRATPTPPTPTTLAGRGKALVLGGAGAVAGAGPLLNQVSQAIQPYADHSDYVQKALGVLATIAAVCAGVGLFYVWLQHKTSKN